MTLVGRYQQPMLRLARSFVPSQAVAEEAVQDTWLGLVRGIERFEGRSSFKTWLFRILVNRARSAGTREHPRRADRGPARGRPVPLRRRGPVGRSGRKVGGGERERLDAAAWSPILRTALDDLPPRQRQVVLLRDVEGLSHDEACSVLGISAGNQRVLLHRGRSRFREILEAKMGKGRPCCHCAVGTSCASRRSNSSPTTSRAPSRVVSVAASRRHLRSCPNCAAYLEQIRMTIELTGSIEPDDLSPEARVDLTELYRRWRSESSSG